MLAVEPLIEEDHQKQRGQYEIKTVGIERQMRAECGAGHPIQLIAQRNPEVEPATVDAGGDFRGGVDGKSLVAHTENQVWALPAEPFEFAEHG